MMLVENPMGVGPNQYPLAANTRGYSERAGVAWNYGSRSANVHHMYLLMGAESGWLGMITFTAFLMWIIISGLKFAFQNKRDPVGDLVLGFTVTMIVIAVHGLYEWIFVTYEVQTIFAVAIGLIAGSIRLRGNMKQSEAHEALSTAKSESSTFEDAAPALANERESRQKQSISSKRSAVLPKAENGRGSARADRGPVMLAPPKSR